MSPAAPQTWLTLGLILGLALWAPPRPAQGASTSPFALPATSEQGSSPPAADTNTGAGTAAGQTQSPFALPPASGQSAITRPMPPVQTDQAASPFALPGNGQQAAPAAPAAPATPAATNATGASQASPFALPAGSSGGGQTAAPAAQASGDELLAQGLAQAKAGDLEGAERSFSALAARDPGNAAAWINLGLVLRKQNRLRESLDAYQVAIQADPNSALAHKNLGIALEQFGDHQAAAAAYDKYLELDPGADDAARVKKRVAWLRQKKGKAQ